MNDGEYCECPDCYNLKIEGSEYCMGHQHVISFKCADIEIWAGDRYIGKVKELASGETEIDISVMLTPREGKRIFNALENDIDTLTRKKYATNE